MKKIAIIVAESFNCLRGQANAELNRIKYLKQIADYQIDVYSFSIYEGWIVRKLRGTEYVITPKEKTIDGVKIHFRWRSFSLIDYLLEVKFHLRPIVNRDWSLNYVDLFKDYDLIMAHSDDCGALALSIHDKYGTPYCMTWHGSDIHTSPFASEYNFQKTKKILDNASKNFMVSNMLLKTSERISSVDNKMVLYNGINSNYCVFDEDKRKELRKRYNAQGKRIVAFVGNLFPVKNPLSLPEIFKWTNQLCENVEFWVMGTGKLLEPVKRKCCDYNLPVKFLGNVPSPEMPSRYNCIDVLVLPSINEGLPLVVVEALACGANVVGSKAGGIPEVIGEENSFERNEYFAQNVAHRIVQMLTENVKQELKPCFSWAETAWIENNIYLEILAGKK